MRFLNLFFSKLFPCRMCKGQGGVMEYDGDGGYDGCECPMCDTKGHILW